MRGKTGAGSPTGAGPGIRDSDWALASDLLFSWNFGGYSGQVSPWKLFFQWFSSFAFTASPSEPGMVRSAACWKA